jgi:hypothetical protein
MYLHPFGGENPLLIFVYMAVVTFFVRVWGSAKCVCYVRIGIRVTGRLKGFVYESIVLVLVF